jgi:hypothetical protein
MREIIKNLWFQASKTFENGFYSKKGYLNITGDLQKFIKRR